MRQKETENVDSLWRKGLLESLCTTKTCARREALTGNEIITAGERPSTLH